MIWRWFTSRTIRHSVDVCKQVGKILHAQRDLLSAVDVRMVEKQLSVTWEILGRNPGNDEATKATSELLNVASEKLLTHKHSSIRENIEVVLVVTIIVLAFRSFFFQPFKIPTGSMQPTLYGITYQNVPDNSADWPTGFLGKVSGWFAGNSYHELIADGDWTLVQVGDVRTRLPFVSSQTLRFESGGKEFDKVVWQPPMGPHGSLLHAGFRPGETPVIQDRRFSKGDTIFRLTVRTGDHLFVDRVSYNFRKPARGDIIVFETKNIPAIGADQFYIKRLVALGGEKVSIGNDRHIRINGQRIDSTYPGFEKVYSFPTKPILQNGKVGFEAINKPADSQYSGHVNDFVAGLNSKPGLAPMFPNEDSVHTVNPDSYLVFGDNSMNSRDSRDWGELPSQYVIGRAFSVYWPVISPRFGWTNWIDALITIFIIVGLLAHGLRGRLFAPRFQIS